MTEIEAPAAGIGRSLKKVDAVPKTTGAFVYSNDLHVDGMLFGYTVRSPLPHARIGNINTSVARSAPGVHAVLTCVDIPGSKHFGTPFSDQPVLAIDRVRYCGEPIALIAAEHPEQARRAAELVEIEFEQLETVIDPERATEQTALHPDQPTMGKGFRYDPRPNVIRHVVIEHGNPAMRGDVSVVGVYEVGMQDQAFLGTESGLCVPDGEGGIDIHVATQWLHVDREQIAPCLGLPEDMVRVHLAGVGGAFGGREDLSMQIHGALLALATNRPVKIEYTREESFVGHVHRHPAKIWAEHRASRDGTLTCVRMRILLDGGAYASSSSAVVGNAATMAPGPYRVPNALIECTAVYTNNPPCGAMRGFGSVQTCFAVEAQMDKLARELAMDPVELRLKNALRAGDILPIGSAVTGTLPVAEVIRRCAAIPIPEPEELPRSPTRLPGGCGNTSRGEGIRTGIGFAVGYKNVCYSEGFDDYSTARVRLLMNQDGKLLAEIHCAAAEVGQGVTNVMTQVAQLELDGIEIVLAAHSTATVGSAGSSSASRQTWMVAGAVRLACIAAREELLRHGGSLRPGDVIDVEREYHHPSTSPLDPETGQATGQRVHVAFICAAMRAVVEVDVELGLTRVVWAGVAQDVGRALNPLAIRGQIEGGAAQGLGLALMEEIQVENGRIMNAGFTDYLIPTALDVAQELVVDLVEEPDPDAPYGFKGVGEPPTLVSTPAIVAAIRNACGQDLTRVPIRPDDIIGLPLGAR